MPVLNPTRSQFDAMLAMQPDGPVYMLNLLRFREQADYGARDSAGDVSPCTGREAYDRYGNAIASVLKAVGGRPVWLGRGQFRFIATEGESWDERPLVRYPDTSAFQAMLTNPDYQAQAFHRDAALADARLVITQTEFVAFPPE